MIDLTQEEIKMLINILNQVSVSGVDNMNAVLGIVKKLVEALQDDSGD